MAYTIIYLVISLLVSLIFIILGIGQYKAEKPVSLNTGEKSPREDELISVTDWNHRHGRNLIILGCIIYYIIVFYVFYRKAGWYCIAVGYFYNGTICRDSMG